MRRGWLVLPAIMACTPPAPRARPPVPLVVPPGAASPPRAPEPPNDGALVRPCTKDSPELAEAQPLLDALSARVEALGAADDAAPLVADLGALLETPCFALATLDNDAPLTWSSALSLRTWWQDGGHDWLDRYLSLAADGEYGRVGTPPTARRTLTADRSPMGPLVPLLCPTKAVDDGTCGTETAGWLLRARSALARQWVHRTTPAEVWCAERVRDSGVQATPYAIYRSCLNEVVERRDALPLGVFRAPTDGWLIVQEQHFISYQGCSEDVRLYDLATGAAYLHRCLANVSPARVFVGRVPVGAIREAAWMMMLSAAAESDVRTGGEAFDLPKHMTVERRRGESVPIRRIVISASDTPVRLWSWMRKKGSSLVGQASGRTEIAWGGAEGHASELLDVANAAFEPGCAPVPPPRSLPWNHAGPSVTPSAEADDPSPDARFQHLVQAPAAIAAATAGKGPCAPIP